MNNLLNKVKLKFNNVKNNVNVRTIFISVLALLLIISITFAWYINNLSLYGVKFGTGSIDFETYVYNENGVVNENCPFSPTDDENKYMDVLLSSVENAKVGTRGTSYIAIKSTGTLGIKYKIAFNVTGVTENDNAYLGGYKYNITEVTDKVAFSNTKIDADKCPAPEKINDEIITIDRNPVVGVIENVGDYDIFRFDYTLTNINEEYTKNTLNIYYNVFATQIDGNFDGDVEERGYTYYCSTKEDIDRAKVEAYPGDIIKLSSDIVYYGDLVFNKPVHLETNDYTLTVNGNLMYDYVLENSLKINAGGLGRIVVQCAKDGVGGNFTIKAPISEVMMAGSNSTNGDIVVEKKLTVDATNTTGTSGVSFNNIRIVDDGNSLKPVLIDSNTRATVSFGTKIGTMQSMVKASNIEIVNNGVINKVDLSNMKVLPQTNSPQIYIINNNDINNTISLPGWSEKFIQTQNGCSGNTRIIQSVSGSPMEVAGNCSFDNNDIEVEKKDTIVEQIDKGNDSKLRIFYQDSVDRDGNTVNNTIQSILENYFNNEATTGCTIGEVLRLEIVSIGSKLITNADISYFNSNKMLALEYLDLERANIYDTAKGKYNRLFEGAFANVDKYKNLILPQSLAEIGDNALYNVVCENIITIPASVTTFGTNWFANSQYVYFASSVPVSGAESGLYKVNAVFVDEPYIASYKNIYHGYESRIYPVSVLDESKNHFVRNTKNDEWEITYYIRGDDSVIGKNITLNGSNLKITSVYDNAYRHNFTDSSVVFADSVENLGANNFRNNKNVTFVDLNRIKNVGANVFTECINIAQVKFGDYLETIGTGAFQSCGSLSQDIELPETMKRIDSYAFQGSAITRVNTGGADLIESRAFNYCKSLVYAELPKVRVIAESGDNEVFWECRSLVGVDMPSLTKAVGYGMFGNCTSLRELYMGAKDDGITLGTTVFIGVDMSKLKLYVPEEHIEFYKNKRPGGIEESRIYPKGEKFDVNFVNGINIGKYIVLKNNDNTYTLVTSNIDYSGSSALPEEYNGRPITGLYANALRNQEFTDVTMKIGNNIKTIGESAFRDCGGLSKVVVSDSLETIDPYAFSGCSNMNQNITLPASMKRIERAAFSYSGITGVNTGGAVSVENHAFLYCSSLVYADMPNVKTIAESGNNEVFFYCSSLVSVNMPSVTKVNGNLMFGYCTSLREIHMGAKNSDISIGYEAFRSVDRSQLKLYVPEDLVSFYEGKSFVDAGHVYPEGERIGNKAINGFTIGDYILLDNKDNTYTLVTSNLDFSGDVSVPNEHNGKPITTIYANAFRNQTFAGANLKFGNNLEVIGKNAFFGTTGLNSVTIDNVTEVGAEAFSGSGISVLNAPKLTSIAKNAFSNCTNLGVINLPKLQTVESEYVFSGCTKLKSVYFEDVKSLNKYTFYGCKALEKITINRLINENGSNMPSTMTIEAAAPCKIYVPYRALSAYGDTWSGKPVVTFDTAASYNDDTYILGQNNEGRWELIDFLPSSSKTSLVLPSVVTTDGGEKISLYSIKYGSLSAVSQTLKNITLSSSIAQLDNDALSECSSIENVYTDAANLYFTSINGVLYSKDSKMLIKYPSGRSGAFDMGNSDYASTVGIGAYAFINANELTEITFPASLVVIDSTAFENCINLNTVEFLGSTPPTLMGSGIFDTDVESFRMIIPTYDNDVVTSYLCALNFAEYEPYIDKGGNAGPDSSANRNQVPIGDTPTQQSLFALVKTGRDDEEEETEAPTEEDTTSGDGPDDYDNLYETEATETEWVTESTVG